MKLWDQIYKAVTDWEDKRFKDWAVGTLFRGSEVKEMKRSQPRRLRSGWGKRVSRRRKSQTMPRVGIRSTQRRTENILLDIAVGKTGRYGKDRQWH